MNLFTVAQWRNLRPEGSRAYENQSKYDGWRKSVSVALRVWDCGGHGSDEVTVLASSIRLREVG